MRKVGSRGRSREREVGVEEKMEGGEEDRRVNEIIERKRESEKNRDRDTERDRDREREGKRRREQRDGEEDSEEEEKRKRRVIEKDKGGELK